MKQVIFSLLCILCLNVQGFAMPDQELDKLLESSTQLVEQGFSSEEAGNELTWSGEKLISEAFRKENETWGLKYSFNTFQFKHCEINGKEVPCRLFLDLARESITMLFNETSPLFQWIGSWLPYFISWGITLFLIAMVLGFLGFLFWLRMLIDAIQYQRENKLAWILIIVFFNFLGALVYCFAGKLARRNQQKAAEKGVDEDKEETSNSFS